MSTAIQSCGISRNTPYSTNQERVLTVMAIETQSALDAATVWRIKHAVPFLATGRIADARNRIWHVPSIRTAGVIWTVELKTGKCRNQQSGANCPDKSFNGKPRCCHFVAAIAAELEFVRANHDNRFLFPDRAKVVG